MSRSLLAIESSCDETSAAVVCDGRVASLIISSQTEHGIWGGVVPELASRAHLAAIAPVVTAALEQAHTEFSALQAVAVTTEPGLVGSLLVGLNAAKGIAVALGIPLISVHHIEAHLLSVLIDNPDMQFPYLGLVVSGGHTLLYDVKGIGRYELLAATRDDAAGEAFDKGAKLLGLGYPGGPAIDRIAADGNPQAHAFPRGFVKTSQNDFSFSGLKTSLRYFLRDNYHGILPVGRELADICASYQEAIVDTLVTKTMRVAASRGLGRIAVVGGVAANSRLRASMREECERQGLEYHTVRPVHGTDNAAMIGIAGWHKFTAGETAPLTTTAKASMIRAERKGGNTAA
ncbi:MAG: tRNA (adenosine(37)-N6)-threonylcarbamoyltransferase complex transferase subunit TsaD [Bacteroidetes bacterium]|nr:tRNA (adenosine(37)-N6)-threonylcarbamoyltransferase complex transferase subunit TsaD [Bacteroidota bacterium]